MMVRVSPKENESNRWKGGRTISCSDGSVSFRVTMGIFGNSMFASGRHSFSMAGAGLAEVRAVQKARFRMSRSSRMRSLILGVVSFRWSEESVSQV